MRKRLLIVAGLIAAALRSQMPAAEDVPAALWVAQIKPFPQGLSGELKATDFRARCAEAHEAYYGHQLHCQ
jgi:hypothetical protein